MDRREPRVSAGGARRASLFQGVALALALACLPAARPAFAQTDPRQQRALAAIDSLWAAGQVDSCWTHLAAEINGARAARDSTYLLDLLALRGALRVRLGLIGGGEPDLREAVLLAARFGDDAQERRSLRWLGLALYRLGRMQEANDCWVRLRNLSRAAGDGEHEAWAWAGLALQHWEDGRPRRALEEYEQALALFRSRDDARGAAYVLNGLGTALEALGRYDEAIKRYREAADGARAVQWTWLEALAQNNIAVLLFSLGDPGQARDLFLQAAELHRTAGDAAEAARAGANVARCEADLGRYEEAATRIEAIREDCRRLGIAQLNASLCNTLAGIRYRQGRNRLAARFHRETLTADPPAAAKERLEALLALAHVLADLDSVPAALALLQQASPWVGRLDNPIYHARYRLELGRIHLLAGQPGEAMPLLISAEQEADRLGLPGWRLPALTTATRAARALGWPDSALALLREAAAAWEKGRGLPADPEWREMRGLAAGEIRTLLGSLLLARPPDRQAAERVRAAFDAVQGLKARTLLERMLGPAGTDAPALASAPATLAQMQREVLHPGELFLDYHLGERESLVFAVTTTECRAAVLPGDRAFGDALALYARLLAAPEKGRPAADDETRGRMRCLLLDPVADLVAASRSLIIAPDGILHRLSFAALLEDSLPAGNGQPRAAGPGQHAEQASVHPVIQMMPSATIFAWLRAGSPDVPAAAVAALDEPAAAVAALDEPATADAVQDEFLALTGDHEATGRPLAGAQGEVRDLAARFRGVRRGFPQKGGASPGHSLAPRDSLKPGDSPAPGASLANLLDAMSTYEVLHFASHATIEEERPWRSRIHLGRTGSPQSATITAADIAGSRLDARLAVLSSCRSAGGRLLSGEGVQSLAGAFLVAGVPAVVATLWAVEDGSTRLFMRSFYDHLAEGAPVVEAVALAQLDFRRDPGLRAPHHWAGFVVIGDGSLQVALERRSPLGRLIGPLALILGGALAVFGPSLVRQWRRGL